eukprot:3062902-Pyramimonas_sp.AAC.1
MKNYATCAPHWIHELNVPVSFLAHGTRAAQHWRRLLSTELEVTDAEGVATVKCDIQLQNREISGRTCPFLSALRARHTHGTEPIHQLRSVLNIAT